MTLLNSDQNYILYITIYYTIYINFLSTGIFNQKKIIREYNGINATFPLSDKVFFVSYFPQNSLRILVCLLGLVALSHCGCFFEELVFKDLKNPPTGESNQRANCKRETRRKGNLID